MCNVIVPAANLQGGWCLIYRFTYGLEWVGHSFLVPYFPYFVTPINHFTDCSHCVHQQAPALDGLHVSKSSSAELLHSARSPPSPPGFLAVLEEETLCQLFELSFSCCLHNNYKRYQALPLFFYSICILYTCLEVNLMEISGL